MAKTRNEIVKNLLREANYYWYDQNEDNVNRLNPDDYDPIVDKIFKANAVELEKLYAELEESQHEVILGLSQVLVPDQSLLPEPGYTVAQIKPKANRVSTSPEHEYKISGQSDTGERYDYYFSPLFEHNYPKCEIKAMLTDQHAIVVEDSVPEIVYDLSKGEKTSSLWVGLEFNKVKEEDFISFFLGSAVIDEFDKDYNIFHQAKWLLNGEEEQVLKVKNGIKNFEFDRQNGQELHLMDAVDIPNSYEKQVLSRFKNSFIHFALPKDLELHKRTLPPIELSPEVEKALGISSPLCWIKLEFHLAISSAFLTRNTLYPNCIPLVNRRLKENHVVKSNYDRIVFPMPTSDLFLDIHMVQDTKNKQDDTAYRRVDFLHPDSQAGTFTLRSGSRVRRFNRLDATKQIFRLLEVIEDEYSTFKEEGVNRLKEDFDVIEKAINRIKTQMPDFFREEEQRTAYFGIANFRPGMNRLDYTYWETQGDLIRHLGDRVGLAVSSNDVKISDSKTMIPIQRGKGELTSEDYINQLRMAILSKNRILTKGDINLYCKGRYGKLLQVKMISREIMTLEDGNLGRGILVTIALQRKLTEKEAEYVKIELQNDLNAKSAFFTQIKVAIDHVS